MRPADRKPQVPEQRRGAPIAYYRVMTEPTKQTESNGQTGGNSAGLLFLKSPVGAKETIARITEFANAKGVTIFTVIDHAEAARSVGLQMPETSVVILGNPKAGTSLMLAHPDLALDLPTRVLVREGPAGCEVLLMDPEVIAARYGLERDQTEVLTKLVSLITSAIEQ